MQASLLAVARQPVRWPSAQTPSVPFNTVSLANGLHSAHQEFRQCVQKLLWPFEVRNVAGALDLHELPVHEFLDCGAAELRPVAKLRGILRSCVAAKEHASIALANDEQHRHGQQMEAAGRS